MEKKPWTLARWVVVVGSILPAVYITIAVKGFVWLSFGPVPFFIIPPAIVGILSIFWANAWVMLLPGVVLTISAIGDIAAGASGDPGTLRPDRTLEFSYWSLATILGPTVLIAGIVNVVQSRKGAPAKATPLGAIAVTLAVAIWLGGVATAIEVKQFVPAASAEAIGIQPDQTINITAQNDKFSPASITIPAGKVVKLSITNLDAGAHVFDQDTLGLKVDLPAGATKTVWVRLATPGADQFYCELHAAKGSNGKYAGMVSEITVQ